jgi:CheY-like chemotaxis protein
MSNSSSWPSKKNDVPVKKPLLLVVEDSKKTQQVIQDRFTELGCDLIVCEAADEAWRLLRENKTIDAIILDFHLPGTKGPAFYEHLTKDQEFSAVPVVPFTSTIDKTYNLKSEDPRDWARVSKFYDGKDNSTPILSKGESEHISFVPDQLILNVAYALQKKNTRLPERFREVVKTIVKNIAQEK